MKRHASNRAKVDGRTAAAIAEVRPGPADRPPSAPAAHRLLTFIGGPPIPRRLGAGD